MEQTQQKYAEYVAVGEVQYMTARKVANDLRVTKTTIHAWIKQYGMPCRQIGQTLLFDAVELNEWVEQQRPKRGRPPKAANDNDDQK